MLKVLNIPPTHSYTAPHFTADTPEKGNFCILLLLNVSLYYIECVYDV